MPEKKFDYLEKDKLVQSLIPLFLGGRDPKVVERGVVHRMDPRQTPEERFGTIAPAQKPVDLLAKAMSQGDQTLPAWGMMASNFGASPETSQFLQDMAGTVENMGEAGVAVGRGRGPKVPAARRRGASAKSAGPVAPDKPPQRQYRNMFGRNAFSDRINEALSPALGKIREVSGVQPVPVKNAPPGAGAANVGDAIKIDPDYILRRPGGMDALDELIAHEIAHGDPLAGHADSAALHDFASPERAPNPKDADRQFKDEMMDMVRTGKRTKPESMTLKVQGQGRYPTGLADDAHVIDLNDPSYGINLDKDENANILEYMYGPNYQIEPIGSDIMHSEGPNWRQTHTTEAMQGRMQSGSAEEHRFRTIMDSIRNLPEFQAAMDQAKQVGRNLTVEGAADPKQVMLDDIIKMLGPDWETELANPTKKKKKIGSK